MKFIKENSSFLILATIALVSFNVFAYATIKTNVTTREELVALEASRTMNHYDLELQYILHDVELIETYVHTIGLDNLTDEQFDEYISSMEFHIEDFVSISVAPDGIIQYYYSDVFTEEDEASIMGRDILNDERDYVREAIEYAIENNVVVTNGPFDLILGGKGLVFRKAMFDENDDFLAIVNYVIDFEEFQDHLNKYESDRILSGVYDVNNDLVFGQVEYNEDMLIYEQMNVDFVDWHIGIQTSDTFERNQSLINASLGIGFAILQIGVLSFWWFYYTGNRKLIKKQKQLIYYDGLSDMPNRLLFEKETNELIERRTPFFLGFGDLDNFKNINDVLGHSVGDQYLSFIATHLKKLLSDNLRIYRWGGDEFIFIFLNTTKNEMHGVMDQIFDIFKKPFEVKETKHQISISIGVVEYPTNGLIIDDLVKRADIVMYDIKAQHKNTYSFFEQKYLDELYNQLEFQQELDKYTVEDFEIYLQPIVDVKTGETKGFEGLSRLFNEEKKQFPTHEIIKLFEQDGTITKLDKYVFRQICKYFNEVKKLNDKDYFFTFNISPLSLTRDYIEYLERTVHSFNVDPGHIIIEIIETLGFKDVTISVELLEKMKRIGFKIAMDDFGMGYSSLSYITKLPLDLIKVDRSFVHDYEKNAFNRSILKTIKDISNSLDLEILVEGIETESQLQFITNLKAQYYQGYLHSKPMSFTDVKKYIKNNKKQE